MNLLIPKLKIRPKLLIAFWMLIALIQSTGVSGQELPPLASNTGDRTLTDPTRPNWYGVSTSKTQSKQPVLNSLVTGPQRRIAVINGELMREGESRHGFALVEILEDRVLIRTKSGNKKVLKLKKSDYRAKVARGTNR